MPENAGFCWRTRTMDGINFFVLDFHEQSGNSLEAWIAPEFGSNLCRFVVDGKAVIDFDPELLLHHDYTGTPILYPTPNRVQNAVFMFRKDSFPQVKRGKQVFEHGLVHDESWEYESPNCEENAVSFDTRITFNEESPLFEAFPFHHSLSLRYSLERDAIVVTYCVDNLGKRELPFGFGLHPYFIKLSGERQTRVVLPASHVMDANADLIPSGVLHKVDNSIFDLRRPVEIGSLDLDHVFTGIPPGEYASIEYHENDLCLTLEATPDFSHLVLYSPRGERYFCIENQTCAVNAHNLFAQGFVKESGLIILPPGEKHMGQVCYRVKKGTLK